MLGLSSPPPVLASTLTLLALQCRCSSPPPSEQLPGRSWSAPASAGPGLRLQPQCSLALEEAWGGGQAVEPA